MSALRDLVIEESTEALERELKAKPGNLNAKIGMVSSEPTIKSQSVMARQLTPHLFLFTFLNDTLNTKRADGTNIASRGSGERKN